MKNLFSLFAMVLVGLSSIVPSALAYTTYSTNSTYSTSRNKYKRTTSQHQPQVIYVYQTIPGNGYGYGGYNGGYPGCNRSDIIIGGQIWASCNVNERTNGSSRVSGWFFANDLRASFTSANGQGTRLEWQGKVNSASSWGDGPCAEGYRLPTRGEWETVLWYARQNGVSVSTLLNLPNNGGYRGYKDTNSDVRIESRSDTLASYWSSTMSYNGGYYPTLMRIGAVYQGYRMDGTYDTYSTSGYNWQYTDSGLELVSGTSSDIANVRCIRK